MARRTRKPSKQNLVNAEPIYVYQAVRNKVPGVGVYWCIEELTNGQVVAISQRYKRKESVIRLLKQLSDYYAGDNAAQA